MIGLAQAITPGSLLGFDADRQLLGAFYLCEANDVVGYPRAQHAITLILQGIEQGLKLVLG